MLSKAPTTPPNSTAHLLTSHIKAIKIHQLEAVMEHRASANTPRQIAVTPARPLRHNEVAVDTLAIYRGRQRQVVGAGASQLKAVRQHRRHRLEVQVARRDLRNKQRALPRKTRIRFVRLKILE